ncbi:MAG: non-homologous end-joining DNA ligase [Gemmatimonadaceae bacterium]
MYATIGAAVPTSGGEWVFEPKYDGIRVLAFVTTRAARLITRNGKDKAAQFPEVARALLALAGRRGASFVVDGEVVALDERGAPARFQQLQARMHVKDVATVERHAADAPAALVAFDALRDGDELLLDRPWRERRRRLESILASVSARRPAARRGTAKGEPLGRQLLLSDAVDGRGAALLDRARRGGWEGIIAKRADAPYRPGARSRDWLKLKIEFRQEFVVGGFTEPRNSREHLGALLLGYFERPGGRFVYVGHTGGGFTREGLRAMRTRLASLERATPPFAEPPRTNERAHWVTPRIVVEVKFSEWTSDGRLRQPIFLGVRDDKRAEEVGREAVSVQRVDAGGGMRRRDESGDGARKAKRAAAAGKRTARGAPPTSESTSRSAGPRHRSAAGGGGPTRAPSSGRPASLASQLARIERHGGDGILVFDGGATLAVSSLDKPFWPKEGITKGELMRYYVRVAPGILSAIDGRPLAMKRYPNGVEGHSFFQQSPGDHPPDAVRVQMVETEDEGEQPRLVGGDLPTLLYTVQLGAIAVNAWHSRVGTLDWPEYTILDLDPGARVPFRRVIQVAGWVREELDALGLAAVAKTSGSTGLHVVVPLPRRTTYDAAAAIAKRVAERVADAHPKEATVERAVGERPRGAVYVDHLQNARGKTLASVFSVRARPGATVSTPVSWRQLEGASFDPHALTIETVPRRLARARALWEGVLAEGNGAGAVERAAAGR